VIFATDGLFDNLTDEQIVQCAKEYYMSTSSSTTLAKYLASAAFQQACSGVVSGTQFRYNYSSTYVVCLTFHPWPSSNWNLFIWQAQTPFMQHAFEKGFTSSPEGGKLDDITVVAGKLMC
jgi:hypothetical protein